MRPTIKNEERDKCIVRFPVTEELLEAARKAGQNGVEIRHGRPVVSPEMREFMECPFPPWDEESDNDN